MNKKEFVRISIGLTITCLIASFLLGMVYVSTEAKKKANARAREREIMQGLLGYGPQNPPPKGLKFFHIYRYIIEDGESRYLGYLLPLKGEDDKEEFTIVITTLRGKLKTLHKLNLQEEDVEDASLRERAISEVIKPPKRFSYADSAIIATLKGKRIAYLIPGEFQGFKTFIKVMLALGPKFQILGLDILEHEEDPGLGGEIVRDYFKGQFKGKPFDVVKRLKVIKKPMPEEYWKVLEKKGSFSPEKREAIMKKYQTQDIYALTGATISSRAVTNGVKNIVKKFAYRMANLQKIIKDSNLKVAF